MAESLKVEEGDVIHSKMDIYQNLIALIDEFNIDMVKNVEDIIPRDVIEKGIDSVVEVPCRIAHIGDQSYGKLPKDAISDQIIMEYAHFFKLLTHYLPPVLKNNTQFETYLFAKGDKKIYQLADFMMMTLESPRINYYQSSNYWDI
jgi:hypothetical protein